MHLWVDFRTTAWIQLRMMKSYLRISKIFNKDRHKLSELNLQLV